MSDTLSDAAIQTALADLSGWTLENGKLHRRYEFKNFTHAFGFMAAAATVIEKRNHHPEWSNVYHTVVVDLWTHDASGITAQDVELAHELEDLATKLL